MDKLPPLHQFGTNGLPNTVPRWRSTWKPSGILKPVTGYKNGENYAKVFGDDLANISDADAMKSRQAQKDFTTKMSGIVGTDVPNPPSANAAKALPGHGGSRRQSGSN
jgi:hypothetical protein